MGLHEQSHKEYLQVSLGKIRKKVTKEIEKAVSRTTRDGETVYELVYTAITGTLVSVVFKDHPEFGRSWNLMIVDENSNEYGIRINEESRYGTDLLKKLPNLKFGETYTFTPYDFEDDKHNRKTGLSIKNSSGQKIDSFYQKFTEVDGKFKIENLNGFPLPEGDKNKYDKDDWKIYFTLVNKFLRTKALEFLKKEPEGKTLSNIDNVDDLPDFNEHGEETPF